MKMKILARATGLLSLALLSTGCISIEREISFSDTPRAEVTFENEVAAKIFFSTMKKVKAYHSSQSIQVFIPLFYRVKWTLHETEWHNHQVRRTDFNGDGLITESEAKIMIKNMEAEEAEE